MCSFSPPPSLPPFRLSFLPSSFPLFLSLTDCASPSVRAAHPFILTRCLLGKPGTIHAGLPSEMINLRTMSGVFARLRTYDRLLSRRPRVRARQSKEQPRRWWSGRRIYSRAGDNVSKDVCTCTVTHEYPTAGRGKLGKKYYTAERPCAIAFCRPPASLSSPHLILINLILSLHIHKLH